MKLKENNIGKNKVYEVLLVKIAVGKSYCLPAKTVVKDNYKLPYGFDSIYFFNEGINIYFFFRMIFMFN